MKNRKRNYMITALIIISIPFFSWNEKYFHDEFRNEEKGFGVTLAYPSAVGILSGAMNCLTCHANNGHWIDDSKLIIDILDKETKKSYKQTDGSFLVEVQKNKAKTVLTVIGYKKNTDNEAPYRNAWLYIDTSTIGKKSLSKFALGWDVNLPMACRIVGDEMNGFEDADITSLPMTIQPLENAEDAEIMLQVMLTKGESVKNKAKEGIIGNYFERKVFLKIYE